MTVVVNGGPTGMKQGSQAWKDLRSCFITGSQYKPYTRPSHLAMHKRALSEKRGYWKGEEEEIPLGLQRTFDWGHFHERIAREEYRTQTILEFPTSDVSVRDTVSMMIDDEGMIAASPDGVVTITNQPPGVIEIKCPTGPYFFKLNDIANFEKYDINRLDEGGREELYRDMSKYEIGRKYYEMDNELRIGGKLEEHYLQCLGNLHLSGAEWCDYIVFVPFKKWYKGRNMRVKRLTRAETEEDWNRTKAALVHAYKEHHETFTENLEQYLAKYQDTDFGTRDV